MKDKDLHRYYDAQEHQHHDKAADPTQEAAILASCRLGLYGDFVRRPSSATTARVA